MTVLKIIFCRSFLRDLEKVSDDPSLINTCSIGSAIADCFIKRVDKSTIKSKILFVFFLY